MTFKFVSRRRYIGAGVANLLLLGAQTLLFLVVTPLLLRNMGQGVYGVWTIMLTVIGFATIANFGTASTAIKYTSQFFGFEKAGEKLSVVFTFSYGAMLVVSVFAFLVILFLRPWLVESIDIGSIDPVAFSQALTVIGISLIPFFLSLVSRGILLGLVQNGVANSIALLSDILLWSGALFVSIDSPDILTLAFWVLVSHCVRFGLMSFFVWWYVRALHIKIAWVSDLIREMYNYSFTIWLGSLGVVMFKSLDRLLLAITLDAALVGVYSIGTSIAIRLNSLANQLAQLLVPFTSSHDAAGLNKQIAVTFRHSARLIGTMLAVVVGILVIWMDVILSLWISQEFAASYANTFRILVVAYGVYSMYLPAYNILAGRGWLRVPVAIQILAGLLTLLSIWRLSNTYGLLGAAYANFAYVLVLLIHFYLAIRIVSKPITTTVVDLGPSLLIMIVVLRLSLTNPSIQWRIVATFVTMSLAMVSALSSGGYRLLLSLLHGLSSSYKRV